ncbi:cysteine desulfurase Csd [Clostridium aceticum]|uniref:cysteine desulfurase n=1 Tax=Clostridium aceticum TaxID=84022 RepID=A0A0D8I9B0_9CLOT|nr:aminotransferase class V-fold PLP-dependent enzyme [Clostridium aceticum]AKL95588.1 cysteine desulfurase Csd [Clostridium aceticum]KJF26838.1 hypothetical protein TZ02_11545 [Clostridium aceticum]
MSKKIYFDNAATTFPKPSSVYEIMDKFYRTNGVNVGRGQYDLASQASILVQETRELLCKLFNCPPNKRVVFTSTATEAINVILQGINWQGGENVYITHFEHNGVLRCLHELQKRFGLNLNYLNTDSKSLSYDVEGIRTQFQEKKPDVVIMNHASNVCGLITPIAEIAKMAKSYQAEVVVDCAQTAGLIEIDMMKLSVDYMIFAGHKTLYGPLGIAGFIIDERSYLKPLLYGGTGVDSASLSLPGTIPHRFEVGSPNIHAISGLNAALKWINKEGIKEIYKKERVLTNKLVEVLRSFDTNLYLNNDLDNHIGVISCTFRDIPADRIGEILNQNEIAVRTGLHCAPDAHKFLNTSPGGTVRFSLGYFNTEEDISRIEEVLGAIEFG